MFITIGPLHPMVQSGTVYTIRRIYNKTVWYLLDMAITDTNLTAVLWTQQFAYAFKFKTAKDAKEVIRADLHHCSKECDVFDQDAMWMV